MGTHSKWVLTENYRWNGTHNKWVLTTNHRWNGDSQQMKDEIGSHN
jgi:2-keto-3-deoxy-galactonokinase